ncbi:MAG TPA: hypothetical protein VLE46_15440 [Nitrospira sp.]|nr:hypothetical protein [Nitrospira sp.]
MTDVPHLWRVSSSIFMAALLAMSSIGCNVVRMTLNTTLTQDDVAFIVPGTTTLTDVIKKLGSPDSITDSDTAVVATYRFLDLRYSRVNFGYLAKPWTPVDPDVIFSRTGLGVDAFEVLCDRKWVVLHTGFQRHLSRPPFLIPYPFQRSRRLLPNELPPFGLPAIMAAHGSGDIRSSVPSPH